LGSGRKRDTDDTRPAAAAGEGGGEMGKRDGLTASGGLAALRQ
jgi:hypothetical protein